MRRDRAIRKAAASVSAHARRQVGYHAKPVERAIVKTIQPLTAELIGSPIILSENELMLGWVARKYDQDHGIDVGDALVLVEVAGDDWAVLDVHPVSKEVLKGLGTVVVASSDLVLHDSLSGVVSIVGGHSVIGKMRVYDVAGLPLGWVQVWDSLP